LEDRCLLSGDVILHWNEILLQSLSSQPLLQPLVTRNMALVHVAMFNAVNAIDRSYTPYDPPGPESLADIPASRGASLEAAAAQAAHDTLFALYPDPARRAVFDQALADDLAGIPPGRARQGIAIGQEAAQQMLALRSDDGASASVPYTPPNNDPGQWQRTLPDNSPAAGAHIAAITPFTLDSSSQFRPPPHPELSSPEYAADSRGPGAGGPDAEIRDRTATAWRTAPPKTRWPCSGGRRCPTSRSGTASPRTWPRPRRPHSWRTLACSPT
jgi:hypothetical protein